MSQKNKIKNTIYQLSQTIKSKGINSKLQNYKSLEKLSDVSKIQQSYEQKYKQKNKDFSQSLGYFLKKQKSNNDQNIKRFKSIDNKIESSNQQTQKLSQSGSKFQLLFRNIASKNNEKDISLLLVQLLINAQKNNIDQTKINQKVNDILPSIAEMISQNQQHKQDNQNTINQMQQQIDQLQQQLTQHQGYIQSLKQNLVQVTNQSKQQFIDNNHKKFKGNFLQNHKNQILESSKQSQNSQKSINQSKIKFFKQDNSIQISQSSLNNAYNNKLQFSTVQEINIGKSDFADQSIITDMELSSFNYQGRSQFYDEQNLEQIYKNSLRGNNKGCKQNLDLNFDLVKEYQREAQMS